MSLGKTTFKHKALVLGVSVVLSVVISGGSISAAEAKKLDLEISSQSADSALMALSKVSGVQIVIPSSLSEGVILKGLSGFYTLESALNMLLADSGLKYEFLSEDSVVIKKSESENEDQSDQKDVEELVVTGSRIARTPSQVAANVLTLDAEALRATGQSTLEGALRQLPQNIHGATEVGATVANSGMSFNSALNITGGSNINLRGLGSESTLVLVDGRRIGKSGVFGGASDISGIPLASVARVEIILDGASSIYGSDAVGGVVNIILKKDYDGGEISYQYGTPEEGGFSEHILTMTASTSWDSGRINATFEHFQRDNLDGKERPDRIRRDFYQYPALLTAFDSIFYRYNGQNYYASDLADLGLTPTSPGVEGISYAVLPVDQQDGNFAANDFTNYAATFTLRPYDEYASHGMSLIPAQTRDSLQMGFEQELNWGNNTILSGNVYLSKRETYAGSGPFTFLGFIDPTDPRNPTGVSLTAYARIPSLPDKHFATDQRVGRWALALDGDLGGDWRWRATAGQSRDRITSKYFNNAISFIAPEFAELEDQGLNWLDPDFGFANSPEMLQTLVDAPRDIITINKENTFEVMANGSLFTLPGGDVYLAVGADWREELIETGSEQSVFQLSTFTSAPIGPFDKSTAGRHQRAGFAEVLIPLVSADNAVTGIKRLNLTGSTRYDSYREFGSDSTWSLGIVWSPTDQITFKSNKTTAYVVPTPRDALIDPYDFNYAEIYPDYYPDGRPLYLVDENGIETGDFDLLGIERSGGNPDLQPETASTFTAGIEITPNAVPGLTLSATWHNTQYHNRIGPAPQPLPLPSYLDYVEKYTNITRDPDTGRLIIDSRAINQASVEVTGVDYRLNYYRDTDIGQFTVTANVGYTGQYDRILMPGEEAINEVANVDFRSLAVIPAYRYSANLGWLHRGLAINLNATTSSDTVSTSGTTLVTQRIGKAALSTDLVMSYDMEQGDLFAAPGWMQKMAFSLRILNVLDDHPEYEIKNLSNDNPTNPELNASYSDPRGRMYYLTVTRRF